MRSPSSLKTTNLTLATYLIINGYEPTLVGDGESGQGKAIGAWEFSDLDEMEAGETLDVLVKEYSNGAARVEPRKFHDCLTTTRRSLFRFLDEGGE